MHAEPELYRLRQRRAARLKPFLSAVPTDEYLVELHEMGVIRPIPQPNNNHCGQDYSNGEVVCEFHDSPPPQYCLEPECPYAATMTLRLILRLREAYALEKKKREGQYLSIPVTVV